jgi:hypothetical protein
MSERRWPAIVGAVVIAYAGLTVAISLSEWRGDIRDGQPAPLFKIVADTSEDPFSRLTSGGLDTFDGLVLAQSVNGRSLGINWTDPDKAIISFVPYAIWPTKPQFFSPIVTRAYTRIGGKGGIFFSGPGYAYIVYRGTAGVIFVFLLLGLIAGFVFTRARIDSIFTAIWAYFFFRFFMAGDSFDAFHALGLVLVVMLGYSIVALWEWVFRRSQASSSPFNQRLSTGQLR